MVSTQDSQLMHIKVDEALSLLPPYLQMQNIKTIKDNNILIATGPPELLAKLEEYLQAIDLPSDDSMQQVLFLHHIKADDAANLLPPSLKKIEQVVLKESNALAVKGPTSIISELESYLKKIDRPIPQILFDILVVEVMYQKNKDLGLDFSLGAGHNEIGFTPTADASPLLSLRFYLSP